MVGTLVGLMIGAVLAAIVSAIAILVVGRLGLGLEVDGFGPAFIGGIVIAILGALITWAINEVGLSFPVGLAGAIVHLIVSAVVLYAAGAVVGGLRVRGFTGALLAAVAIAVLYWVIDLVVTPFVS